MNDTEISTFYQDYKKNKRRIYTTLGKSGHHARLRRLKKARTYVHAHDAILYFCGDVPLDAPLTYDYEIITPGKTHE